MCAKLALLTSNVDIHTLTKQIGNTAAIFERHYSKLTATMAAEKLASFTNQNNYPKQQAQNFYDFVDED
jgi:hypothetical protein